MKNPLTAIRDTITGISVPQAEERAKAARQATIEAGAALQAARAALAAADEAGDPGAIQKAESGLVVATLAADRATRALEAAERRLEAARTATSTAARHEANKCLADALRERVDAASQIDQAADQLAAAVEKMRAADASVAEAARAGVVSTNAVVPYNYGGSRPETLTALALAARRLPSTLSAYPGQYPSTVQAVERDNTTIAGS